MNSQSLPEGLQNGITTSEDSLIFPLQLKIHPTIIQLGIYSREFKTYFHTEACTKIFITALFVISPKQKLSTVLN